MAWNNQGGGFDVSPSKNMSPGVSRDRGNQEKNGIRPICIKSIHRSLTEDSFKAMDGTSLTQVTLIAKVLEGEMNNQRFEYKLGDATGETILAREYINDEDQEQPPLIKNGEYVRVYGTLKSFQGTPHIVLNRIAQLKNPNEITTHILETMYTYLKMKKSDSDKGAVDKNADIPDQVRIVIQSNKTMTGMSISEIKSALPHLTHDKIMAAIEYLSGEGFIFSTIDDEHYRATEDS